MYAILQSNALAHQSVKSPSLQNCLTKHLAAASMPSVDAEAKFRQTFAEITCHKLIMLGVALMEIILENGEIQLICASNGARNG